MSHVNDTLEVTLLLTLYYRVKYVSLYCYVYLAKNLHKVDHIFHTRFSNNWIEIHNTEKNICSVINEHYINVSYLGSDVFYNFMFFTDLSKCLHFYMFGEMNFYQSFNLKFALRKLFILHTFLNIHLLHVCSSIT